MNTTKTEGEILLKGETMETDWKKTSHQGSKLRANHANTRKEDHTGVFTKQTSQTAGGEREQAHDAEKAKGTSARKKRSHM